jgi:hypothetical protein
MKKLTILLLLCIVPTTIFADIINIQTSGIVKVMNGNKIMCQGDYSFTIDIDSKIFCITRYGYGETCFSGTGTYSIKTVKRVQDSYMGTAFSFLLSKNGIEYLVTFTSQLVSFSQMNHTNSECWNFFVNY